MAELYTDTEKELNERINKNSDCCEEMKKGMNNLDTKITILSAESAKNVRLTEKIHENIIGNGKEGLNTRVSLIENSTGRIWWFVGIIATALVVNIIAIAIMH